MPKKKSLRKTSRTIKKRKSRKSRQSRKSKEINGGAMTDRQYLTFLRRTRPKIMPSCRLHLIRQPKLKPRFLGKNDNRYNLSKLDIKDYKPINYIDISDKLCVEGPDIYLMLEAYSADKMNIETLSFCPTIDVVNDIIQMSIDAEKSRASGERNPIYVGKLSHLPGKIGLTPDSLNPNDTILVKLGKKVDYVPKSKDKRGPLVIIMDASMPIGGTSNGLNGVLIDCQKSYGKNRMNLFYKNIYETKRLLDDYLKMRDTNINEIFKFYVKMLKKHQSNNYSLNLSKDDGPKLDECEIPHYDRYIEVMDIIKDRGGPISCGFRVNSYCQTWAKYGLSGNAEFSVMSPHFQTRFYLDDIELFNRTCGDIITNAHVESYIHMILRFNEIMNQENYDGKFINLDNLSLMLNNKCI